MLPAASLVRAVTVCLPARNTGFVVTAVPVVGSDCHVPESSFHWTSFTSLVGGVKRKVPVKLPASSGVPDHWLAGKSVEDTAVVAGAVVSTVSVRNGA
ncbi:hypothetical protein SMICM17S_04718 [Streptomyces microflavus]